MVNNNKVINKRKQKTTFCDHILFWDAYEHYIAIHYTNRRCSVKFKQLQRCLIESCFDFDATISIKPIKLYNSYKL